MAEEQARKTKRGILLATPGSPVALDFASRHDGFESSAFGLTGLADGPGTGQFSGLGGAATVHQAPVLLQRYPLSYYYARQSLPVVRDVHAPHQRPAAGQPVRLQAPSQPISVSQQVDIPQTVSIVPQSVPLVVSAVSSSSAGTGFSSRIDSSRGVAVARSSGLAPSGLAATDLGSRGLTPNLGYASSGGVAALGGVGSVWKKRKSMGRERLKWIFYYELKFLLKFVIIFFVSFDKIIFLRTIHLWCHFISVNDPFFV